MSDGQAPARRAARPGARSARARSGQDGRYERSGRGDRPTRRRNSSRSDGDVPDLQRLEERRGVRLEPAAGCRAPATMARRSIARSGNVTPSIHAAGTSLGADAGHPEALSSRTALIAAARLHAVQPLAAAVPRLLHLVALGEQPLQVQHRQIGGLQPPGRAIQRHARFVQRQAPRAVRSPSGDRRRSADLLPVGRVGDARRCDSDRRDATDGSRGTRRRCRASGRRGRRRRIALASTGDISSSASVHHSRLQPS